MLSNVMLSWQTRLDVGSQTFCYC